jgi:HPt (histidine-containing phosphotransfer) domain-containing protein
MSPKFAGAAFWDWASAPGRINLREVNSSFSPADGPAASFAHGGAPAEADVLDLRVLEEMGLIPRGAASDLPAKIIRLFLQEERPRMGRLAALVAERNAPELARMVHNLAGSSAILGARQVQGAAVGLELAARAGAWPAALAQWEALQGAWVRLEAALTRFLAAPG